MRKLVLLFLIIFLNSIQLCHAQLDSLIVQALDSSEAALLDTVPTTSWSHDGNFSIIVNQSAFSNWVAGGDNSAAFNTTVNQNLIFEYKKWSWNTRFNASVGFNRIQGNRTKKTDDRWEINSILAYEARGKWKYSFFGNVRSQFIIGYKDYNADPLEVTSNFFSPGYINFGPGMIWRDSDNLYVNLSPLTSKITHVRNEQSGKYGVEEGKNQFYEFGFNLGAHWKFQVYDNVTIEHFLTLYSDYLHNPKNVLVDYQITVVNKINKYISTNLNLHMIGDDNASSRIQFKEVFGLGVTINY